MWCPQCKSEFIQGIFRCPDCEVDLVSTLPEEPEKPIIDKDVEFVDIMNIYDAGVLTLVKSILEDVGIPYFIKGEHSVYVFSHIYPARVLVVKTEAEKAKQLLKDLIPDEINENPES